MTLSHFKRQVRREQIADVATVVAVQLVAQLREAGLVVQTETKQAKTGTVYLAVRVFTADGRRLKHLGAAIRIADHRARPSDRWVNFSRPACRFYGIWIFSSPWRIVRKVDRISRNILQGIRRKGGDV